MDPNTPMLLEGRTYADGNQNTARKKFERAPGTTEGVQRKEVNQSVMMDSQLNESSI